MKWTILKAPEEKQSISIQLDATDSMTMKFQIPPHLAQRLALKNQQKQSTSVTAPEILEPKEEEPEEESWETLDIDNVELSSEQTKAETSQEEWVDNMPTYDVTDDFPILIVNLSRFGTLVCNQPTLSLDEVNEAIHQFLDQDFVRSSEQLFSSMIAYHATYGTSSYHLLNLQQSWPKDQFTLIDYPTELKEVPLVDLLSAIRLSTKWKSVNQFKHFLSQTSRDIVWKANISYEIEQLAHQQEIRYLSEQQDYETRINQLIQLRGAFQDRLTTLEADLETKASVEKRLLVIEQDLVLCIDALESLLSPKEEETVGELSLIDMVAAMIFDRLPKIWNETPQQHYQSLSREHAELKALWKQDFGCLPYQQTLFSRDSVVVPFNEKTPEVEPEEEQEIDTHGASEMGYSADEEDSTSHVRHSRTFKFQQALRLDEQDKLFDPEQDQSEAQDSFPEDQDVDSDESDDNQSVFARTKGLASLALKARQEGQGEYFDPWYSSSNT